MKSLNIICCITNTEQLGAGIFLASKNMFLKYLLIVKSQLQQKTVPWPLLKNLTNISSLLYNTFYLTVATKETMVCRECAIHHFLVYKIEYYLLHQQYQAIECRHFLSLQKYVLKIINNSWIPITTKRPSRTVSWLLQKKQTNISSLLHNTSLTTSK